MRLIRTELYFSPDSVVRRHFANEARGYFDEAAIQNPGVSVVWIPVHSDDQGPAAEELFELFAYKFDAFVGHQPLDDHELRSYLDLFIQGAMLRSTRLRRDHELDQARWLDSTPSNTFLIPQLLQSSIVVERSPPEAISLAEVVKMSSAVGIGTFIGSGIAGGSFPLMLLTVPLGIVIVGSAIGISRGLENGLHRGIERLIKRRLL